MTSGRKALVALVAVVVPAALVLAAVFTSDLGDQRGSADDAPPRTEPSTPSMPSGHLLLGGDGRSLEIRTYPNDISCSAYLLAEKRTIAFRWAKGTGVSSFGTGPVASTWREQPLRFWPNCVEWISDDALLVSGVSPRTGRTIIEVWEYETPQGAPDALPVTSASGRTETQWLLPSRTAIDTVFDSDDVDRQVMTLAKENKGRPGHVFVRFDSSDDLLELELATGDLHVVASPVAGAAPLHVPELANAGPWDVGAGGVVHQSAGFAYVITTHLYDAPDPIVIVFLDADRDGTLDAVDTTDTTGYHYLGDEVLQRF